MIYTFARVGAVPPLRSVDRQHPFSPAEHYPAVLLAGLPGATTAYRWQSLGQRRARHISGCSAGPDSRMTTLWIMQSARPLATAQSLVFDAIKLRYSTLW
jgi:hypothetical protein